MSAGTFHAVYGALPWVPGECGEVSDNHGKAVARVVLMFERSDADVEAIQRLIAAGPEIVRRAEDLMEWLESQPDLPGAIPHRVQKMRAALALLDAPQEAA